MNRRQVVALGSMFSVAGCLRMQEQSAGSEGSESEQESSDDEQSFGSDSLFDSRESAIEYASAVASDEDLGLTQHESGPPDQLIFGKSAGRRSTSSSPDGMYLSALDIDLEPTNGSEINFTNEVETVIHIDDYVMDSSAVYTLEPEVDEFSTSRIKINTNGAGELREETPTFLHPSFADGARHVEGAWSGDTEMFGQHPFGIYRASIREDDNIVAETNSVIHGIGYPWRFAQTADRAFLTRHASVPDDWVGIFTVAPERGNRDERSSVVTTQDPEKRIFEADITKLGVESGQYYWEFALYDSDDPSSEVFVSISGIPGQELFVG